jgi:rod shape-determining protein MreC
VPIKSGFLGRFIDIKGASMARRKRGLIKNRPALITVIIVLVLIALMIMTAGEHNMSGGESVIGTGLIPIQGWIYSATDTTVHFVKRVFNPTDLRKENKLMKEDIVQFQSDLNAFDEMKKENERLKKLLKFKEDNTDFDIVTAKITGKNPGNWFSMFTINRGVLDGVQNDMPVMTSDGLVGRVVETGATWSKVISVIDPDSGVSSIVELTRDNGVVRGTALSNTSDPLLEMLFLPFDADLLPGYRVITSGLGGVFPKGLVIGDTVEITRGTDNTQKAAFVKPSVDFLHLEEVMIITSFKSDAYVPNLPNDDIVNDAASSQSDEITQPDDQIIIGED